MVEQKRDSLGKRDSGYDMGTRGGAGGGIMGPAGGARPSSSSEDTTHYEQGIRIPWKGDEWINKPARKHEVAYDAMSKQVREAEPITRTTPITRTIHEVTPKVERERERTEIRHVVQPIRDRTYEAPTYSERELAPIEAKAVREEMSPAEREKEKRILSQVERASSWYRDRPARTQHETRYASDEAIIRETIHPCYQYEIHPLIQREVVHPHIERDYVPVREKIYEGPRVSEEIREFPPISREEWERLRLHGPRHREERYFYDDGRYPGRGDEDFYRRGGGGGGGGYYTGTTSPTGRRGYERDEQRSSMGYDRRPMRSGGLGGETVPYRSRNDDERREEPAITASSSSYLPSPYEEDRRGRRYDDRERGPQEQESTMTGRRSSPYDQKRYEALPEESPRRASPQQEKQRYENRPAYDSYGYGFRRAGDEYERRRPAEGRSGRSDRYERRGEDYWMEGFLGEGDKYYRGDRGESYVYSRPSSFSKSSSERPAESRTTQHDGERDIKGISREEYERMVSSRRRY